MDILDKINEAISLAPEKLEDEDMQELAKLLMQKVDKRILFIANPKDMDTGGTVQSFAIIKKFLTDNGWAYINKSEGPDFFTKGKKRLEYHHSSGNLRLMR